MSHDRKECVWCFAPRGLCRCAAELAAAAGTPLDTNNAVKWASPKDATPLEDIRQTRQRLERECGIPARNLEER